MSSVAGRSWRISGVRNEAGARLAVTRTARNAAAFCGLRCLRKRGTRWLPLAVVTLVFGYTRFSFADSSAQTRPVTIPDSIASTEIGDGLAGVPFHKAAAVFSPDHARFLMVTHRGNLMENTNEYRLLLFESDQAFSHPRARIVATFATSANEPGISQLHWLADNETALFVGRKLNGHGQIYALNMKSERLRQLTHESADVTEFDVTPDMHTIVFKCQNIAGGDVNEKAERGGIIVSNQSLGDLISGRSLKYAAGGALYVWRQGRPTRKVTLPSSLEEVGELSGVSLSPDGRYAIINSIVRDADMPSHWVYDDKLSGRAVIQTFTLIDTHNATGRLLLNGPIPIGTSDETPVWSADSKSIIADAYVPGDHIERTLRYEAPSEVAAHQETPSVVEVNVQTDFWSKIASGRCAIGKWNPLSSTIAVDPYDHSSVAGPQNCGAPNVYREMDGRWVLLADRKAANSDEPKIRVEVVQDLNSAPEVFVLDPRSGRRSLLLDLNPQYRNLKFGRVREIQVGSLGETIRGGLYYPVSYVPGRHYPLVIQTHGWEPHRFEIDGQSTAGYAAQTLAGEGYVVVQLDVPCRTFVDTAKEGKCAMVAYQNIIEMLDKQGLVDHRRVGLQTWSRSGLTARYTAAFSKYPIAASIVVDAFDTGYFAYMSFADILSQRGDEEIQGINGGPPVDEHMRLWLQRVPEFNLQRVHTPILQFSFERDEALGMWEFFAGLELLHKPVEYVVLPSSNHWPVRPSDRIAVQQRSVDWFRFWLEGYERTEPIANAGETSKNLMIQYERWEKLCDEQIATDPGHPTFCSGAKH